MGDANTAGAAATGVPGLLDDFQLDMLGQQPLLKIYTQIAHLYPLADASDASKARIVDTLTAGLERLSAAFPWVAGQVVNSQASEGDSGVFHIRPLERIPQLVVKDLTRDDAPATKTPDLTWAALEKADFPMNMLDEDDIAPIATFPQDPLARVLSIQATFIDGGLILTFSGHHAVMDMVGQANLISWLSRACAGGEFTEEELRTANRPRHDIIPLLSEEEVAELDPEILSQQVLKKQDTPSDAAGNDSSSPETPAPPPQTNVWSSFTFTPSSLSALKAAATTTLPPGAAGSQGFVTTDDALTALIWSATTRVRQPRLSASSPPVTISPFARAINIRPYFNLPHDYAGLFQNMTYHALPVATVASPSALGAVAGNLRKALDPATTDVVLRTRALATFMHNTKDKAVVSFTAAMDLGSGVMFSSWARIDSYELDFALGLGKPASVRRPRFTPVESLGYLLPKARNGDISIAICLREEEMAALREDGEWKKYARYVG